MEMKIHCTSCSQVLRVPKTAAGRRCRCPACHCKFTVPAPKDLLDETISTWIEEDVDHLIDEKNQRIIQVTQMHRQALEREKQKRLSATASRLQKVLDAPYQTANATAPKPPAQRAAATAGAIRRSLTPATQAKTRGSGNSDDPSNNEHDTDHVGASGYPNDLFPKQKRPYLIVDHCDQQGVTLAFDAEFLTDAKFATSLPLRCVFTGEADPANLIARPLAFCDRSKGQELLSPHQIESGHESHLGANPDPLNVRNAMGVIEQLSSPFEHPMPYYLCANQGTLSLACWSHTRSNDHGITAYVQIPDGFYALEWLARVNGMCGPEYAQLKVDVESLFGGEWRQLGEDCRRRLAVWCPFEPGERFCHFVSDADFNHHDMGLAGLVLTDRRLVYHKYHKRGQMHYEQGASILIEPGKQGLAMVSIQGSDPSKGKSKGINLHMAEVPRLIAAAAFVKLPAKIKIDNVALGDITLPDGKKISIGKDGDVATEGSENIEPTTSNQSPEAAKTEMRTKASLGEIDLGGQPHDADSNDANDMTIEGLLVEGLESKK